MHWRKLTQESRNEISRSAGWRFRQGGHGEAKWTRGETQPPPPPAQRLRFRSPLLPAHTLWIVVHELKHCRLKNYSNQSITSSCDKQGVPYLPDVTEHVSHSPAHSATPVAPQSMRHPPSQGQECLWPRNSASPICLVLCVVHSSISFSRGKGSWSHQQMNRRCSEYCKPL